MSLSAVLAILAGLSISVLVYYSGRVTTIPSVRAVKEAYPIINVALLTIAEMTNNTPYDYLFDAAAAVWAGPGLDNQESARLVHAAVEKFRKGKYLRTKFDELDPAIIAQGQKIGREVLAKYQAN